MTRHILTTATLIAFLAAGQTPITAGERRGPDRAVAITAPPITADIPVVQIDGHLLAVRLSPYDLPDVFDVALQLEPDHHPGAIHVWTGRKNGWGSIVAQALPDATIPGLHHTLVQRSDGSDRLWIGLDRPGRRPAIGVLPLT